jgi:hypothetical protein
MALRFFSLVFVCTEAVTCNPITDVGIVVSSPKEGAIYQGGSPVFALVDLKIHDGAIANLVRANISGFELCVSWDAAVDEDGDEDVCQDLLVGGELPSMFPNKMASGSEQRFLFRASLRSKSDPLIPVAITEVSY